MNPDLITVLVFFFACTAVLIVYCFRVFLKGPVHYERLEQQGNLLNKRLMEVGYWFFQPLARFLIFLHVNPNQISWGALILGLLAGWCLSMEHFGFGAVFASFSFITLDGILMRGLDSDAGEVFDTAIDRYVEFFFISGLVIYYKEVPILMVFSLLALVGSFMVSYSSVLATEVQVAKNNMRRPERAFYLTLGAALSPLTVLGHR